MNDQRTDRRTELLSREADVADAAMTVCKTGRVAVSLHIDPANQCCLVVSAVWARDAKQELIRWWGSLCTTGTEPKRVGSDLGRQVARELSKARAREGLDDTKVFLRGPRAGRA